MKEPTIHIYTSGDQLPANLDGGNFFHSPALFELCKQTPKHRPYMVTAEQADGTITAHLLAVVRYRSSFLPPYFYMHCHVLGEGVCTEKGERHAELFGRMIEALTKRLGRQVLYIEVSNLSQKMFGYKEFRKNGFFPVRWMSIHNSLHSMPPKARLMKTTQERISHAKQKGVETMEVKDTKDFQAFSKLLRHHNWLKPRRYVPHDRFFQALMSTSHGRLSLTKYKTHAIGCSAVVFSQQQAYLWYTAFRRKSFAWLHPAEATVWNAIDDAYRRGCEHIFFMDVGLPYSKNPFREFILSFGGKPVSTYRWFRCSISWVNKFFSWLYRE